MILIVEDDPDDQVFITESLKDLLGYEPRFFQDGGELLPYLETEYAVGNPPKLIILCLRLPQYRNGFKTLSKIKSLELYRDVPVIVFTTSSSGEDSSMCKELGAVDFVTMPGSFEKYKELLIASVQRWCKMPAACPS